MAITRPSFFSFFFTILCLLSSTLAQLSPPPLSPSPSPLSSTLAPTSPEPAFFPPSPAPDSTFSPTSTPTPAPSSSSTPTPTPASSPSPYPTTVHSPSSSSLPSPLSSFSPPAPPPFSPSPSPSPAPLSRSSVVLAASPSRSGLTGGQKAGISMAVLIGLAVAGIAAFIAKKRRDNIRRAQFGRGAGGGAIRRDQL